VTIMMWVDALGRRVSRWSSASWLPAPRAGAARARPQRQRADAHLVLVGGVPWEALRCCCLPACSSTYAASTKGMVPWLCSAHPVDGSEHRAPVLIHRVCMARKRVWCVGCGVAQVRGVVRGHAARARQVRRRAREAAAGGVRRRWVWLLNRLCASIPLQYVSRLSRLFLPADRSSVRPSSV
jgi:hypothetical protein